jgi:dihydrofolate reductase
MGHHIVMGRKTYESIGKPLPGRTSIVITRNAKFSAPGVVVENSLSEAITLCADDEEIFVIGGAELYRQAINIAERIYLTEIDADIPGDAHFMDLDSQLWQETERVSHMPDESNVHPYHFVVYNRKS